MVVFQEGNTIVLRNKITKEIVVGVLEKDFDNGLGLSALIHLNFVSGLPIESGVLNMNFWDVVGDTSYAKGHKHEQDLIRAIRDLISKSERQK